MFELRTPNKFVWTYKFLYWNDDEAFQVAFYTMETKWGFKYAENIAIKQCFVGWMQEYEIS